MISKDKKRVSISVSREENDALSRISKRDHIPLATKARELLKIALQIEEDGVLNARAQKRDTAHAKYLSHEEAWK